MKNLFQKNQLMITALAIMIAIAGYLQFAENTADKMPLSVGTEEVSTGKVITENYISNQNAAEEKEDILEMLDLSEEDLLSLKEQDAPDAGEGTMDIASLDSDVTIVMEDYLEEDMELLTADAQDAEPVSVIPEEGEIPGEAIFTSALGVEILSDAKLLKEQTRARNKETLLDIIGNEFLSDEQKQTAVSSMVRMTEIAEKEAAAEILLEAKGFSDVVVSISDDGADVVVNAVSLSDAQRAQIEDIVVRKTGISPENIIISTVVKD